MSNRIPAVFREQGRRGHVQGLAAAVAAAAAARSQVRKIDQEYHAKRKR